MTLQCKIILCQQSLPTTKTCAEIILHNVQFLLSTNDKSISEERSTRSRFINATFIYVVRNTSENVCTHTRLPGVKSEFSKFSSQLFSTHSIDIAICQRNLFVDWIAEITWIRFFIIFFLKIKFAALLTLTESLYD